MYCTKVGAVGRFTRVHGGRHTIPNAVVFPEVHLICTLTIISSIKITKTGAGRWNKDCVRESQSRLVYFKAEFLFSKYSSLPSAISSWFSNRNHLLRDFYWYYILAAVTKRNYTFIDYFVEFNVPSIC